MTEYFVRQFDGGSTACDGRNCAAASGATAVAFGSGGKHTPTSDQFRTRSGVSCVPGAHSPSGGLFISDVERTARSYGVTIDYGRDATGKLTRWTPAQQKLRLSTGFGMVTLGDYDQIPPELDEQPGFDGDHSTFTHDYRESDLTVCWHDPLGRKPRRVRWSVVEQYNHKPGSPVRGLAGFVRIATSLPDTATEDAMKLTDVKALSGTAVITAPNGYHLWVVATGAKTATLPRGTKFDQSVLASCRYLPDGEAPKGYPGYLVPHGPDGELHVLPAGREGQLASFYPQPTSTEAFNLGVEAAAKAAAAVKR